MTVKKYDVVATTGEYTDKNGETKKQYKNVGAILKNDNGHYMVLDRTFNPAGLPNPENRSNCILGLLEPKEQQQPVQQPVQQGGTNYFDDELITF